MDVFPHIKMASGMAFTEWRYHEENSRGRQVRSKKVMDDPEISELEAKLVLLSKNKKAKE